MNSDRWINDMFQSIDNCDNAAFMKFLTEDVNFTFGNAETVAGKAALEPVLQGFFDSIKTLDHEVTGVWEKDNMIFSRGKVTYTRHDETTLSVPFANIFEMNGDLIGKYNIYIDISQLYV